MATRIHTRLFASALVALACATAPVLALADDGRWDHDQRSGHRDHDDRRDDRGGRHDRRDDRYDRRQYRDDRREVRYYDSRRVYRPGPPAHAPAYGYRYQRGARYYDDYRGPIYVVNDYPSYHLRRPPYGYHWVRDDRGNYLMVAIATGIIADLLLHH